MKPTDNETHRELRWIVLLVVAIAVGTKLRFPMNVIQTTACGVLLAVKLKKLLWRGKP